MDKQELTGENMGHLSNFSGGMFLYCELFCLLSEVASLELKNRPEVRIGRDRYSPVRCCSTQLIESTVT